MDDNKIIQNELAENQVSEVAPVKDKNTFLLVWKIIVAVLYTAITAFLVWGLIDALGDLNTTPPSGQVDLSGLGIALYLVIVVLILGSGAYLTNIILSIIGLVVAGKKGASKGTKIYFVIFIVLPIITEIVIFFLGKVLGTNG